MCWSTVCTPCRGGQCATDGATTFLEVTPLVPKLSLLLLFTTTHTISYTAQWSCSQLKRRIILLQSFHDVDIDMLSRWQRKNGNVVNQIDTLHQWVLHFCNIFCSAKPLWSGCFGSNFPMRRRLSHHESAKQVTRYWVEVKEDILTAKCWGTLYNHVAAGTFPQIFVCGGSLVLEWFCLRFRREFHSANTFGRFATPVPRCEFSIFSSCHLTVTQTYDCFKCLSS